MKRSLLILLILALVLVPGSALASPEEGKRAGRVRAQIAAQAEAPPDAPSQDNYGAVIYNHFGSPSAGQALIETWTRQTYSDLALPINNQGFVRAVRLHNVKFISVRVVLHTRGGTDNDDATGATYNNRTLAGNPRVFNGVSPTISTGGLTTEPQFCESFTTVHYAIRWSDDTLTSGKILTSPADLFNDNCYFEFSG